MMINSISTKPSRLKDKRRKLLRKKITIVFLLCLVLLISLSLISRSKGLLIKDFEINGNNITKSEDILKVVNSKISGNYLFLFSKKNILIYPRSEIKASVLDSFKRISNIKIEQGESQLITLSIEEREGEYLWCNYFDERETDECYFVAKDGYIFSEAPYFSGDIFFRFYSYLGDNPVGKNIIESEKFKRLMFFKNNLLKLSINPHLFFIRGDGDYEFLFNNTSFNRWEAPKIIFKTEDDFEEIYKKLEMVLRTDPLSLNFQEKLSSLLYIDLRYDGKVPFKFK